MTSRSAASGQNYRTVNANSTVDETLFGTQGAKKTRARPSGKDLSNVLIVGKDTIRTLRAGKTEAQMADDNLRNLS